MTLSVVADHLNDWFTVPPSSKINEEVLMTWSWLLDLHRYMAIPGIPVRIEWRTSGAHYRPPVILLLSSHLLGSSKELFFIPEGA
jgi:hypothetical protein